MEQLIQEAGCPRMTTIRQQLDAPGADYVQGRFYGNGLIWADVHSAPQSGAR